MSWKRLPKPNDRANRLKVRRGSWSMAARLTILYALSAFGLLALASGFLFWVLATNLEHEDAEFLSDKINSLRTRLMQRPQEQTIFTDEVQAEHGSRAFPHFYLRLLDAGDTTLVETPGMGALLASSIFPLPSPVRADDNETIKHWNHDGKSYWVTSAWVGRAPGGSRQTLQIALDRSSDETLLAEFRRMTLFALGIGLLLSALLGYGVARRGMRPVARMTETVQRIRVSHLDHRVGAEGWPGELLTLADTFDRMLDRLENAFARLSRFSADLAHELRTPLNNLQGEAEVALARSRSADEYRQVVESSLEEYARLSRMIDSLLFLARAESLDAVTVTAPMDARAEVEAVVAFHEAVAQEKEIALVCEGAAMVCADSALFRRAVSNLLANALQYTPCGGRIVLTCQELPKEAIIVTVADTGCGIAPEHLPKVFDRFYRADPARSQYPQGTGLGLAIVQSIMELHEGAVTIQSEPGQGTTVMLRFPTAS